MRYFDYETIAGQAGIPSAKLNELVKLIASEEPHDPMMAELHVLRTCMAIKNGKLTVETALEEARALAA